jgi:uncharacterized surface protein with fasciclin (FAS1) repeats
MFYRTGIMLFTGLSLLSGSAIVAQERSSQGSASGKSVMVGGAPMFPTKNIIENAVNSKDHTTLVAAVKAAGLVETLQGKGPFTVFAPVNAAFEKLPAGTVDTLLKPENKSTLQGVLTYHVVPGSMDSNALMAAAKKSNGKLELKTVNGATLWVLLDGDTLSLQDGKGTRARITTPDVYQSNGVIHVIDTVVMAK